ncbi:metabotropic glutamate receptor 3 isoform X1 [Fopius arisanus]|uniref:Metabotropic glutamate receptor 3 isoform X1 n=1 Tax=Fopius arisanus TaxID=64838 RepID=A0A9R1U4G7_9HYME|nr:PREDICTED: metabotropic glutamate receptor 3-like isoform X1 [Fopius arisanus]XP_011307142.1 PREDICTED: metabotropic glutamate receptor 3-like isoform X1 [Fopius arisanus]
MSTLFLLVLNLFAAGVSLVDGKLYVNISGDITLGGLFPVHRKGSGGQRCGKIQWEDGIQPLEAMLYTVQQINQDPKLLPGIKLGALAFDSCDNANYALEQALNFVKGFIAHVNEFHEQEFQCSDGSIPRFRGGGFDKVVAVLAAQSSSITLQVAAMLRLFTVPQISYMATSPSLSNKERYPHFYRTVPSDVNQAHAMLAILKRFEWTYVSAIYSDTEYGNHGYETLVSLANNYSICFSAPQKIDKERFTDEDYKNVIRTIANTTEVRVVVIFSERSTTLRVLEAARTLGFETKFVWIGSDAWSNTNHREFINTFNQNKGEEKVLEGALAVQPLSRHLAGFDDYFKSLRPDHQAINPWFGEFWEDYHRCNQSVNDTSCSESGYKQQKFLHFVRDAVYAIAHALHDMQVNVCGKNHVGMCDKMRHIDGDTLSLYLNAVTFKDEAGSPFRFVNNVDGPLRYSILNFQRHHDGTYHWHVVGNYTRGDNGEPILYINSTLMKYRSQGELGRKFFPNSTCSETCLPHQVKVREKVDPCCWRCRNCGLYQWKVDDHRCEDCEWGTRPSGGGKFCAPIDEDFIDYSSPWAVGTMAVASCGILLTIFVLSVFWIYSDTPVIKASGRELSSLLLLGTLVSFLMTFAMVAEPTTETCAITRFGIGLCYTLCYAALVTKTNRIHRIFNKKCQSPHKPRYTSPKSQLCITGILTLVEVIINGIWLLQVPPGIAHSYPTRDSRLRICKGLDDRSYMVGLIYPFMLIVACTIYAIKTRKCPEGFNETRHIAFTNYTTMVLWLAFVPLYLASTNNSIRVVTLALSLSLSGLVQLGCSFFPKVYIVLMKPEKNTKELVMAQHRSSSYLATPSATPIVVLNGHAIQSSMRESQSSLRSSRVSSNASNFYNLKPLIIDSDTGSIEGTTENASDSEIISS